MEFYQHVYGRVIKGYRNSYVGYQLAALTDSLFENQELIENLNRFSFFHRHDGEGNDERYSFYRPIPGYLAFGCSRLVKGSTGAIGALCHHFIYKENEFRESFKITEASLEKLRLEGVPDDVLGELESIRGQKFVGKENLISELKNRIGEEQALKYKSLLFEHVDLFSVSPVALFEGLRFIASEEELDSNRSLDMALFDPPEQTLARTGWYSFALSLIDIYLGESVLVIPMIILSPEKTWDLLRELFSLLPAQEASRLSFSTLFKDASDFIEGFRLVFVPDRNALQGDEQIYRVLEPDINSQTTPMNPVRPVPFTRFWRETPPEQGPLLVRLINLLRHWPEKPDEAADLLPGLLARGKIFRDVMESLSVPRLYLLLVRNERWMKMYKDAGGPLDNSSIREAVWTNPYDYLIPALKCGRLIQSRELLISLYHDLAREITSGGANLVLLELLRDSNFLTDFYKVNCEPQPLSFLQLEKLAERLRDQSYYEGQFHHAIAQRILREFVEGHPAGIRQAIDWLKRESTLYSDLYIQAIANLFIWADLAPVHRPDYRLSSYALRGVGQYEGILSLAWVLSNSLSFEDRIRLVFHSNYRPAFFSFCARRLTRYDLYRQKVFLETIAIMCEPHGHENAVLIDAIRYTDKAYELARYYAGQLEKLQRRDVDAIRRLKSIPPPKGWLSSILGR